MIEPVIDQIPRDFEAEQSVLGAIILNNDLFIELDFLTPNSFFSVSHQYIYRAVIELFEQSIPIDEITLGDQLKSLSQLEEIGGYAYLNELTECCPSSSNIVFYGKIIREHARMRDMTELFKEAITRSRDPKIMQSEIVGKVMDQLNSFVQTENPSVSFKKSANEVFDDLENENFDGILTGLVDIDKQIIGMEQSDLILIGGRPSMGKTSIATNIGEYVAGRYGHVMIASLDMSRKQITQKIISQKSGVPINKIRSRKLDPEDWEQLHNFSAYPTAMTINDESGLSIPQLRSIVYKQHKKTPLTLLIVDHIQKMTGSQGKNNQNDIMTEISNGLKNIAKDLNIVVIALSQLNRKPEERSNKRPISSDLRDSGSLEQDADIIIFMYRDEYYYTDSKHKGKAEAIIAKQRQGPVGTVWLSFNGPTTNFNNLSTYHQ